MLSSIPLPRLLGLIDEVPEPVRQAAAKLRCSHLHYLDLALRRKSAKDFHWAYVPEAKVPVLSRRLLFAFFRGSRPSRPILAVRRAGRSSPPDLERLLPEVARGLIEMGVIDSADEIQFARARRIDYAYVIFDHDYFAALDVIRPVPRSARESFPVAAMETGTTPRWKTRFCSVKLRQNERSSFGRIRMSAPEISIIIPVYNEEGILHSAVVDLRERLAPFGWSYEIILAGKRVTRSDACHRR